MKINVAIPTQQQRLSAHEVHSAREATEKGANVCASMIEA